MSENMPWNNKEEERKYFKEYRKRPYVKEKLRAYNKTAWPKHYKKLYEKRCEEVIKIKMERGGKCAECGYGDEVRILVFHHLRDKKYEISRMKNAKKIRQETDKCVLLCPNCHALIHLRK